MIFKDKKAIFFDLDGTLIDSSKDLAIAVNFMLEKIGRETFRESIIQEWVGNGATILTKRALSGSIDYDEDLDEDFVKECVDILLEYYSKHLTVHTKMYPNVAETLKELKSRGYSLVVITNKPKDFVKPILNHFGLQELFEFSLGGDSLSQKKPHPMPLLYSCEKLNISPKEALMVGDSKNDIISAKGADIDVVVVSYGYNHGESLQKYNPNIIIDDFSELLEIVS